jgi:penicillin-binding protein 1A
MAPAAAHERRPEHPRPPPLLARRAESKPRLKKGRLALVLVPLSLLALVSTIFGLLMAVAADLPALENEPRYRGQGARNSVLTDVRGNRLGRLASDDNRLFVPYDEVSSFMRSAIISVEDERFATNNGVDLRGIGRAFVQDVIQRRAAQGGSTITQQFVKNALQAQDERTVFQKLRESALAYHLTRKWGKQKILQEYLNSIYFGNGAYGIESAAQTYFGQDANHRGCGDAERPCAKELKPHEAALLAGMVASPSLYDPTVNPERALARRNLVLRKMLNQRYLTPALHEESRAEGLPGNVRRPRWSPPRPTSRPGCASSSSTASAPGGPSRAACRSRPRSTSSSSAPPRRPCARTCPGPTGPPPRSWPSTTARAPCGRWSPGRTSTPSARSTWPRRASASPGRR